MKPEEFAQGERVRRATKPDAPAFPDGRTAPSLAIIAKPLASRMPFSSSFLQPEQFIAELKATTGADIKPDLSFLASRHRCRRRGTQAVENGYGRDQQCGTSELAEEDLESLCEPASSVPTLELCYEGKPAPAPARLRTTRTGIPAPKPTSSDKPQTAPPVVDNNNNSEEPSRGSWCAAPVLSKSSSHGSSIGRSFREIKASNGGEQSGRLRMLRTGSMEFLKSLLERKPSKKGASKSGKPDDEQRIEASTSQSEQEVSGDCENDLDPHEDNNSCSSRSSASSVNTTYSEVSSKSQSYKHAHKRSLKAEVVKSKLWLLRVHQKVQGPRGTTSKDLGDEGDGIYEALRRGAMFQDHTAADSPEVLNGAMEKHLISKLVAKHKRNSTWGAEPGNNKKLSLTGPHHIFSPKQPRLPTRDAHVLLAPPKRLAGNRDTELQPNRPSGNKPSHSIDVVTKTTDKSPPSSKQETVNPTATRLPPLPAQDQTLLTTTPALKFTPTSTGRARSSAQNSSSVSPIRVELQSSTTTPPIVSSRNGSSAQRRSSFPPGLKPAPLPLPVSAGPQSSLIAGWDATSSRSDSAIATARKGANNGPEPTGTETENALARLPREPLRRLQGSPPPSSSSSSSSFEQIVAGRGRSPPTDNTLMKFFFKCREIDSLNKFLALQKRRFLDNNSSFADSENCFHMIMSEAGAGLSSMISTICTAWLLENTMASASSRVWHPIPVMNMCHKDMWNHRDAAWLFHVCGIDANAVLFRDEITPNNEAVISGRVKRAVIGQDILVTKADEVASSCTIVSEKFQQEAPKLLQARYMMTLLLAGILVDTSNLTSGSPRDQKQATIALVGAGSLGRNGFYNHLMNIRDEDYVTVFIKEIYGESNALTGEKPARLAQGVEQSEAKGATLRNGEFKSEKPGSLAPSPVPPHKPTPKLSSKSQNDDDRESSMSRTQTPVRAPRNSRISLALRRWRNRSSAQY